MQLLSTGDKRVQLPQLKIKDLAEVVGHFQQLKQLNQHGQLLETL